ncbi:MAG: hypothetical protein HY983_00310 [Candidatus Magasanikbacteria bacterium]|nr:hypothetical protein [Candidatus Magasanikbacteria bacterium]
MKAQVDVWEKDNAQSAQSFAQNLDERIKETEIKLDKLVNAFLDGSIEKETYLVKKDELIKRVNGHFKLLKSRFLCYS